MTTVTKTPAEIADPKRQWADDPIWDIEQAEGFEAHLEELRAYRLETEARWERARTLRLYEKAAAIGCPYNLTLAEYVERLEDRIEALERRLDQ